MNTIRDACLARLAHFSEPIKGVALQLVEQRMSSQAEAFTLIDNIFTVTLKVDFNRVPYTVYVKGLRLLLTEDVEVVTHRLSEFAKKVIFPTSRIQAFPERAQILVKNALAYAIDHVTELETPDLYLLVIESELEKWEARLVDITARFKAVEPFFIPEIDHMPLVAATECSKGDTPYYVMKDVFEVFKAGLTDQANMLCHTHLGARVWTKIDPPATCRTAIQNVIACRRYIFTSTIRPSAHVAFCNNLARQHLRCNQLLDVYSQFIGNWRGRTYCTLEDAVRTIPCQLTAPTDMLFMPPIKTKACVDSRSNPVHLQPVDRQALYCELERSDKTLPQVFTAGSEKDSTESGMLLEGQITYTTCARRGRRERMEDAHLVTTITLMDGTECPFFALMDGHGGNASVSDLLKEMVAPTVQSWLNAALFEKGDFDLIFRNALKVAMVQLDALVKSMSEIPFRSGSTCMFCFIYKNRLFTVNMGDSRAVLSSGHQLNIEANASSLEYRKKIEKRGGTITKEGRIGVLLPFSNFGNYDNPYVRPYTGIHVVALEPQSSCHLLRLILCCDGVTDRCTTGKLQELLCQGKSAQDIVALAYDDGAEDNLTAIVLDLPYTLQ